MDLQTEKKYRKKEHLIAEMMLFFVLVLVSCRTSQKSVALQYNFDTTWQQGVLRAQEQEFQ